MVVKYQSYKFVFQKTSTIQTDDNPGDNPNDSKYPNFYWLFSSKEI